MAAAPADAAKPAAEGDAHDHDQGSDRSHHHDKQQRELTLAEKIKKEQDEIDKRKWRNQIAVEQGEVKQRKTATVCGMLKFALGRISKSGICAKLLILINVFFAFIVKIFAVLVPLILKEVVDSIVCHDGHFDGTGKIVKKQFDYIHFFLNNPALRLEKDK